MATERQIQAARAAQAIRVGWIRTSWGGGITPASFGFTSFSRSSDFDGPVSRLQSCFDLRPQTFYRSQERFCAAIAQTNPDEPRFSRRAIREIKKIFILADDDAIVLTGVRPDFGIGGASEVNIDHMLTVHATGGQKAGQRYWKLVIDQKLHYA
jgi:hypothetical protein